jgi:hypothetical protein
MAIDTSGNIGIGTTAIQAPLHIQGGSEGALFTGLIIESNNDTQNSNLDVTGIEFKTDGGVGLGRLIGGKDGNYGGASVRDGYLSFHTLNANSYGERMRINAEGDVFVGKTLLNQTTTTGITMRPTGTVLRGDFSVANNEFVIWNNYGSPAGTAAMQFRYDSSVKGSIGLTSSAVSFNTSSDYRLKENVSYSWDATTRLKQLKPARFNWIEDDTNTLIDGFLGHEVSSIVPEAITGEKDAVYPVGHELEGEINPQGIDQSKLVPLLVKAIQELEARITELE